MKNNKKNNNIFIIKRVINKYTPFPIGSSNA